MVSRITPGELKSVFDQLEAEARALLAAEGFKGDHVRLSRMLDCRYHRQVFSVEVEVEDRDLVASDHDWLARKFEDSYQALYQHSHKNVAGFVDTCRVAAFGIQPPLVLKQWPVGNTNSCAAQCGVRKIYLGTWIEAPVYWFDDLTPKMMIRGPAVVDSASTSVLIASGSTATIDQVGSIQISRSTDEPSH